MSSNVMNTVPFPPFCPFTLKWAFSPQEGTVGIAVYFKFPPILPGDGTLLFERKCSLHDGTFAFDQVIGPFSCHVEIMLNEEGGKPESIGYILEFFGGDDSIAERQFAGNIPLHA